MLPVLIFLDKANRLDVGNAENPRPSDEDKKLVVVKSPNAVNPLLWDYSVSILKDYSLPNSCSDIVCIIKNVHILRHPMLWKDYIHIIIVHCCI